MFIIGRIVDAGGQHSNTRFAGAAGWCQRRKGLPQLIGVILNALHLVLMEQLGEHLHHGFAVFQHIADTGRCSGIVFQHIELVFARANNVCTDNMGIDAAWWREANHFRKKGFVFFDQFTRNTSSANDFLLVIDVIKE
ncbi:hypothetical protein D3C80_1467120 [compost metagenome]